MSKHSLQIKFWHFLKFSKNLISSLCFFQSLVSLWIMFAILRGFFWLKELKSLPNSQLLIFFSFHLLFFNTHLTSLTSFVNWAIKYLLIRKFIYEIVPDLNLKTSILFFEVLSCICFFLLPERNSRPTVLCKHIIVRADVNIQYLMI